MSNHYHKRIFVLHFSDETLAKTWDLIKSEETTADAIYAMVGRQVMRGLLNAGPRTQDEIDLITGLLEERELTCSHYAHVPCRVVYEDGHRPYLGSLEAKVHGAIEAVAETANAQHRAFVLGAVLSQHDKSWSFHS